MDLFLRKALKGQKYTKNLLTPEGSERKYFRVKTKKASYILAKSSLKQQKKFITYLNHFSALGLNIPKLLNQDLKKGYLLLEDLGDESLEKKVLKNKNFTLFYQQALEQMLSLQSYGLKLLKPRATLNKNSFSKWLIFKKANFFKEMLYTQKHLVEGYLNITLKPKVLSAILKEWQLLCKILVHLPYALSHRDYHSRNLFIKGKKVYIIDFQDVGFFPEFYDLVSLIYDPYVAHKMNQQKQKKLINYFISNQNAFKISTNLQAKKQNNILSIEQELSLTAIQRLFKATGSFAGFYMLKKQKTHLPYILPALNLLEKHLKALNSCGFKFYKNNISSKNLNNKNPFPNFLKLTQKLLKKLPRSV